MSLIADKAKLKINKLRDSNQKTPAWKVRSKIQWGQFRGEQIAFSKVAPRQLHIHTQNKKVELLTQNGLQP